MDDFPSEHDYPAKDLELQVLHDIERRYAGQDASAVREAFSNNLQPALGHGIEGETNDWISRGSSRISKM